MIHGVNLIIDIIRNLFSKKNSVHFVTDGADWVIKMIGEALQRELRHKLSFSLTTTTFFLRDSVIHYGTIATLVKNSCLVLPHPSNKIILTWFHIEADDSRIKFIPELNRRVHFIHTACELTKNQLIHYGFSREKIKIVPLGVDTTLFRPYTKNEKNKIHCEIGLPDDKIIIGSFQKDGNGWGEGLTPKLVKGPDVFCDVVEKLAKKYDVHVLLTGPARGYVKERLKKAGIGCTHKYLKKYSEVVDFYNVLDIYLITSRIEGGPMALLESWACGVPVVSTKVGMVADLMRDEENGLMTKIDDVEALAEKSNKLLSDSEFKKRVVFKASSDVSDFDWKVIGFAFYRNLYMSVM